MTSTTTSRTAPQTPARLVACSPAARLAAAGLLALAAMVPFVGTSTGSSATAVQQVIAAARSQTDAIAATLERAGHDAAGLVGTMAAEVSDAVESARAATDQARAALAAASEVAESPGLDDFDGRATVELADAQVALEAAVAQVRHVTAAISDDGGVVPTSLVQLGEHLDTLRGRTAAR